MQNREGRSRNGRKENPRNNAKRLKEQVIRTTTKEASATKNLISRINNNVIARNLILAACGIIVFIFLVTILLNLFTRHNVQRDVPDFTGMTLQEAEHAARDASLDLTINDSLYVPAYDGGIILDQLPEAGSKVKPGRRIFLTVNSYRQRMVRIPYVTGFSLRQAKNNLETAGLTIDELIYRPDIATNYILEQRYQGQIITPGSTLEAEQGSGITLIVGMGEEPTLQPVPKTVGFPLNEAQSRLWEVGLNIGKVEFDPGINLLNRNDAHVYAQSPEQGRYVTLGTPVTLKLTLDDKKVEQGSIASDKAAKQIAKEQAAMLDTLNNE